MKEKSFVDLFNSVLGVYVHEQGEQLPEFVRNCNVQVTTSHRSMCEKLI